MSKPILISSLANLVGSFFDVQSDDSLIEEILKAAVELTGADRGTLFLAENSQGNSSKEIKSLLAMGIRGSLRVPQGKGIVGHVVEHQASVLANNIDSDKRFYPVIDELTKYETKTVLCVPLKTRQGICLGALELLNSQNGAFTHHDLQVAEVVALFGSMALQQYSRIHLLEEKSSNLVHERNRQFRKVSEDLLLSSHNKIFQETLTKLPSYAASESPVLVLGESGTGKELVSRFLHIKSPRADGPFVVLNCASIPETLFEAELFGVAKGAATGTVARKGKVEMADRGTLFLDEIGEMPLSIQAKLLRVLQDKVVCRLGAENTGKQIDFRLVTATNKNLLEMVRDGKFREDLYYRLHVLNILLPPLRERKEDLPVLIESIFVHFSRTRGWKKKKLSQEVVNSIQNYNWPGNIRELQNRIERAFILSGERNEFQIEDFDLCGEINVVSIFERTTPNGLEIGGTDAVLEHLLELPMKDAKEGFEQLLLARAIKNADGNKSEASRMLGVSREGLRKALKKKAS